MQIAKTAIIAKDVILGKNCIIEDYVIIGSIPSGYKGNKIETRIGDNAIIRSHTVIYAGNTIGNNFQTGNKANIRECNNIGNNVSIGTTSVIEHHVVIGNGVRIHTHVFIPEFTVLEDECWIGPNVVITNAKYPRSPDVKKNLKGPCIRKHALIGANSTLLPGVVIGIHALVGAGSVVTRDIPDGSVVVGNPAHVLKSIDDLPYGEKK